MKRPSLRIATIALAVAIPLGGVSIAHADPYIDNDKPSTLIVDRPLTVDDIAYATKQAEHLFTVLLVENAGVWVVNHEQARLEGIDPAELSRIAEQLNNRMLGHSVSSQAYRHCVLDSVGLGAISGAVAGGGSQLSYLIAAKKWTEVAWVLGRLAGMQALKGGVAGAAVALAAAGAWCATPFAR